MWRLNYKPLRFLDWLWQGLVVIGIYSVLCKAWARSRPWLVHYLTYQKAFSSLAFVVCSAAFVPKEIFWKGRSLALFIYYAAKARKNSPEFLPEVKLQALMLRRSMIGDFYLWLDNRL